MYEGQALACDWLDTSIVTVAGLHSKLLYVDCLPGGFRDMSQFRTLFSQVANPPYCQVLYTTPATTLFFFFLTVFSCSSCLLLRLTDDGYAIIFLLKIKKYKKFLPYLYYL